MKKVISLFKRDYEGNRQVYDEVVEGAEWVIAGEGIATEKFDGIACMVRGGKLYKRYDRKRKKGKYKSAPDGWEACQEPDDNTGHWPGWLPVGDGPEDQWHREGFEGMMKRRTVLGVSGPLPDATYELVGPKIGVNAHHQPDHTLWQHGTHWVVCPRTFDGIKEWFKVNIYEGIVWHHPDGRMVKIKRRDFGYNWPEDAS